MFRVTPRPAYGWKTAPKTGCLCIYRTVGACNERQSETRVKADPTSRRGVCRALGAQAHGQAHAGPTARGGLSCPPGPVSVRPEHQRVVPM